MKYLLKYTDNTLAMKESYLLITITYLRRLVLLFLSSFTESYLNSKQYLSFAKQYLESTQGS